MGGRWLRTGRVSLAPPSRAPALDVAKATWENRGAGTSPPLAVFLDHETRSVVVAVRGTMDAKDCIADLTASPAFFDPLGMAAEGASRLPPFNDAEGVFGGTGSGGRLRSCSTWSRPAEHHRAELIPQPAVPPDAALRASAARCSDAFGAACAGPEVVRPHPGTPRCSRLRDQGGAASAGIGACRPSAHFALCLRAVGPTHVSTSPRHSSTKFDVDPIDCASPPSGSPRPPAAQSHREVGGIQVKVVLLGLPATRPFPETTRRSCPCVAWPSQRSLHACILLGLPDCCRKSVALGPKCGVCYIRAPCG